MNIIQVRKNAAFIFPFLGIRFLQNTCYLTIVWNTILAEMLFWPYFNQRQDFFRNIVVVLFLQGRTFLQKSCQEQDSYNHDVAFYHTFV